MRLKFGCAAADITPRVGSLKAGWIVQVESTEIGDPLSARVAVLESGASRIAFVQLDVLSVSWKLVSAIRAAVSRAHGFPPNAMMICATHNHAGPAVATVGNVPRDDAYCAEVVAKTVDAFGRALNSLVPAQLGIGRTLEWRASSNRRAVTRDGVVRTHGLSCGTDPLYLEGPIDPEMAVIAVRNMSGDPIGCLVNFAMHPTYHGGDGVITANFPGVIERRLRENGYPFTLYLQGCCGNVSPVDHDTSGSMERDGYVLADAALRALNGIAYSGDWTVSHATATVNLPFRRAGDEEIRGVIRGAQRFGDPAAYDRAMPALLSKIRSRGTQLAEVQVFHLGAHAFVSLPGEIFVELGLRIKEATFPVVTHPISCANGMIGYVPHAEAFKRGGYETTFAPSSKLAPEAGDLLVETAVGLVEDNV